MEMRWSWPRKDCRVNITADRLCCVKKQERTRRKNWAFLEYDYSFSFLRKLLQRANYNVHYYTFLSCRSKYNKAGRFTLSRLLKIRRFTECNKLCRRPPQYARPLQVDLWPFDLESGVRVTCDVGYLCANFSFPRPLCSLLRPDVRDRQTSDAHHRLMHNNTSASILRNCQWSVFIKCGLNIMFFGETSSHGRDPLLLKCCGTDQCDDDEMVKCWRPSRKESTDSLLHREKGREFQSTMEHRRKEYLYDSVRGRDKGVNL